MDIHVALQGDRTEQVAGSGEAHGAVGGRSVAGIDQHWRLAGVDQGRVERHGDPARRQEGLGRRAEGLVLRDIGDDAVGSLEAAGTVMDGDLGAADPTAVEAGGLGVGDRGGGRRRMTKSRCTEQAAAAPPVEALRRRRRLIAEVSRIVFRR